MCSAETLFGNIGLNSGKVSFKVMLFILTSKCSHIIDITGRSEDIKKTLMASTDTDDAVGLKGKLHTCYRKQEVDCIFNSGGPGSSVSIATDYGLNGPGSNPGGNEIFQLFRPALGPTQLPVQWVLRLSRK